jgi:cytochrome c-type biogenesis protein CcmE
MALVIVEPDKKNGGYKALQKGQVVARGGTQKKAGDKAHNLRPNDTIEAARVRYEPGGIPDEFRRRLHGPELEYKELTAA